MKKVENIDKKIAIGAGVVAAGATAYMLLGPDGKKNRAKVRNFAQNVSKEVKQNKDVQNVKKEIQKIVKSGKAKTKKAVNEVKKEVEEKKKKAEEKLKKS